MDESSKGGSGEIAVGIDLGTTNSVIASVGRGKLELIPDEEGRFLHPSMVSYPPGEEPLGSTRKATGSRSDAEPVPAGTPTPVSTTTRPLVFP